MSTIVQQRLAALRAAKLAATGGTNEPIRDERKDVPAESGAQQSSDSGSTDNSSQSSQPVEPARNEDVQSGTLDVVVLSDQLQPATLVVVEQPTDDGQLSSDDGRPVLEESTDLDRNNPVHFNFLTKLKELETALLLKDPLMKTHLGAIHKTMNQYDDIPNLLKAHEIAKIMAAQQVHTNTTLAQTVAKKKSTSKSVTGNLTLNDI